MRKYLNAYLLYFSGCLFFSLGATLFILSNLGTDPLDVLCVGVQKTVGWKIGTTQSVFAFLCLLVWSAVKRFKKFPPLSSFLTFFICGYTIDLMLYLNINITYPYLAMLSGVLLCLLGSVWILMSGFGVRAMDLVALAIEERTKTPFWLWKGFAEVLLLIVGWMLGGVAGIGTIGFLLGVGWGIQPMILLNKRLGVINRSDVSMRMEVESPQSPTRVL